MEFFSLPRLLTLVCVDFLSQPRHLHAIPDTGAKVTVAGVKYLSVLKLKCSWLNASKQNLKQISVIGSCFPSSTLNSMTTIQEVYFVPDAFYIFLSITACIELKLIHKNFPFIVENAVDTQEQEDLFT